ncbi:hypothetical protein [Paenibacillus sp. NAIST15-1]|uniref:hypothetical protein n=1 Tax=Paenibacillus sp. NAIST15-1 TaxID=1605994 RepID=UPI00086D1416|nr:hypothetical protein [Paenibacillus sp. NAIST15-1]GAV11405.1 poly(Glycerol-phosphate) alpha-glucosyltransferase [Paenibacillus sp. NAIST15-1]
MQFKYFVKKEFVVVMLSWKLEKNPDSYFIIRNSISEQFDKPVYFLCSSGNSCSGDLEDTNKWILRNHFDFEWQWSLLIN